MKERDLDILMNGQFIRQGVFISRSYEDTVEQNHNLNFKKN